MAPDTAQAPTRQSAMVAWASDAKRRFVSDLVVTGLGFHSAKQTWPRDCTSVEQGPPRKAGARSEYES